MSGAQSRCASLVEAAANTVLGYALAVLTQVIVFPLYGIAVDLPSHLGIGAAFVAVSLVRGYVLRRIFERIRGAKWLSIKET